MAAMMEVPARRHDDDRRRRGLQTPQRLHRVGSSTVQVDRSGGALQVLGTPRLVELSEQGDPITTDVDRR